MPLDPFFSRYDGKGRQRRRTHATTPAAQPPDDYPQRLASRRPTDQAHRAPDPPPAVESSITSEKPLSEPGRGQIRQPQHLADLAPFLVQLSTVVESPARPEPTPLAIDAEALRLLDEIAALHPADLAGLPVGPGVRISHAGRFLAAHRQALVSPSPIQRRTASANIAGASAALRALLAAR